MWYDEFTPSLVWCRRRLTNMKSIRCLLSILFTATFLLSFVNSVSVSAAEKDSADEAKQKYSLGDVIKTKHDSGFTGKETIGESDPHYGWKLGQFYVQGYTGLTKDNDKTPVFLKNVGDKVELLFRLDQDIKKLNNEEKLTIAEDNNGYDESFGIKKTNFKHGALIIQKTNYANEKEEPVVYTDYLASKAKVKAEKRVELFEEGDYQVSLDYEIEDNPRKIFDWSIVPTYTDYKISFKFSVRNGNCMVFPRDVKTKSELSNSAIAENGFFLDLAKSRYLKVNLKKEILKEGANGLTEDVRFNRPAKDGDKYTDEGIYTITVENRYTGQVTTKKIYVGKNNVLKAVVNTGLSVKEIKEYINRGAVIDKDGNITVTTKETVAVVPSTAAATTKPVHTEDKQDTINKVIVPIAAICVVVLLVIILIVLIKSKSKKKKRALKSVTEDEEVE